MGKIVLSASELCLLSFIFHSVVCTDTSCRVVENVYAKTMANTDISIEEIKEKIKETWPKLEAIAKSVDVVNL